MRNLATVLIIPFLFLLGCTQRKDNQVWIYTSLYKDTIADIAPILKKEFPELEILFYQAGSEEIAAKVNGEIMAGGTNADILISSDRFWYEELAENQYLTAYQTQRVAKIPPAFKHPRSLYHTLSLPVMVLAYNNKVILKEKAPVSFKEMTSQKWKGQFSTGSPLASGTNFTTVAFLSKKYGWDYFKKLQANGTISEGGNSAVLRRIQNQERPVGWVLLENILRYQNEKIPIQTVFPIDGVILHNNVLAITKKQESRDNVKKIATWFFSDKGQEAMVRSYMYSPFPDFKAPKGAPPFTDISEKAFPWSQDFVSEVVKNRAEIKEKFSEIMFN